MLAIEDLPTKLTRYDMALLELVERDTKAMGDCILSRERIARELGCSAPTVVRSVERLVAKGALSAPGDVRHMAPSAMGRYAFGPLFFSDEG